MKTRLDCIPCILRQALEASRMFTQDKKTQALVLKETLSLCEKLDMTKPAPFTGRAVFRRLKELTGAEDPYLSEKRKQNAMALRLLPELRALVNSSADRLGTAVRLAIAGNIIDMGAPVKNGEKEVREAIKKALGGPVRGNLSAFKKAAAKKEKLLYIADNAGEIVFDRLLIEELGPERVTLSVRGNPVLNDALKKDAEEAGLSGLVKVIDTGLDLAGVEIEKASPEFRACFKSAGTVIAKGQGNYETLSESSRPVYFLFKAKCRVIAENAGVRLGDQVLAVSRRTKPSH